MIEPMRKGAFQQRSLDDTVIVAPKHPESYRAAQMDR